MKWPAGQDTNQAYSKWLAMKKQWNKWFSWYPVTIQKERVWPEWVERRGECAMTTESGTVYGDYEYRHITLKAKA